MAHPNLLLITSDQQHWNTLGCLNPEIQTPNLDRLAARGTRFSRAYCPNPTCTPTRASMITGQYPSQHGAWSLGTKLPETALTLGDLLQAGGYDASLIGKAHFQPLLATEEYPSLESYPLLRDLEFWRDFNGPFYGFNHVELARNHADESHAGQHYALWMEKKGLQNWEDHFQNVWHGGAFDASKDGKVNPPQKHRWSLPEEFHTNAWIAERSIACMEDMQKARKPFFVWASFMDPHPPYLVPEPWDSMYDPEKLTVPQAVPGEHRLSPPHFQLTQEKKPDFSSWAGEQSNHGFQSHLRDPHALASDIAVYYGMVSCMDKYIGRILDFLDAAGLAENTLIVFTSDHGHFYGQHGLVAKGPFHYEDLIRVPFLVSWPGRVPEGVENRALQSLVDLPQTFLSAAGLGAPRTMTGVDQLAVWEGRDAQVRDSVSVEMRHQAETIHVRTCVDARYKITVYFNREYGELFDLESDPGETRNLWSDPDAQELKQHMLLKMIHSELGKEPMWMPRIAGA